MVYYIGFVAESDKKKAVFLRLFTLKMVPDDLRAGGDYNASRIDESVRKFDLPSLD